MESQEILFESYSSHLFLHVHTLNAQNLCALHSILSDGDADISFSLFDYLVYLKHKTPMTKTASLVSVQCLHPWWDILHAVLSNHFLVPNLTLHLS